MAPRKSGRTHNKVRVGQDVGIAQDADYPSDDGPYPPDDVNYPPAPDYANYPSDDDTYPPEDANHSSDDDNYPPGNANCPSDDADEDNTGRGAVSRAISTIVQYFEENTGTDDVSHAISTIAHYFEENTRRGAVSHAVATIVKYFEDNASVFRELKELRQKGWHSAEAGEFFKEKRRQADENSKETFKRLKANTGAIANDMQRSTEAFTIKQQEEDQFILDLCMAPGIYLCKAFERNPEAFATAFTLPVSQGGLRTFMTKTEDLELNFLDITMLAADMGIEPDEIPPSHPEADSFIHKRYLDWGRIFDLVLCDGAKTRAHKRAGHYSLKRESRRLLLSQLILGLEHLFPGGTMIVLLHKVESLNTIRLLHAFNSFATVVLYKHESIHAKGSSFYMIASEIRSKDQEALQAVQEWKRDWKISTFGTKKEWHDDYARVAGFGDLGVEGFLEEFGPTLVDLGKNLWKIQADALNRAPWMKK